MKLTLAQQEAVRAPGNVLVIAGAGSGKTSTLVERCVSCLLDQEASLDEILMLTFTDAAAAEMRQRIRERLESALAEQREVKASSNTTQSRGINRLRKGFSHWQEQLALFETAHIGTLHSFCLELVRQHFYELELDPKFSVMPDEEARLLANETLEKLFDKHYSFGDEAAEAVQHLIQIQGSGWDYSIRRLVLKIHEYTQTLPNPGKWFEEQLEAFGKSEPGQWLEWLLQELAVWRERWLESLQESAGQNRMAARCAAALAKLGAGFSRKQAEDALHEICEASKKCPFGRKAEWRDPFKDFLAEADFLFSVTRMGAAPAQQSNDAETRLSERAAFSPPSGEILEASPIGSLDPLVQDWKYVAVQMTTLLRLARQFTNAFGQAKREMATVDFHDLEQFALRLLWDAKREQASEIAQQWRQRLRFVFVDEYQDINAAQDKIIECLCREAGQANRFMVGDVKQSIYRFRLANPSIFQRYVQKWGRKPPGEGIAITLSENFRSREVLLGFINSFFGTVMRRELGSVHYDEAASLKFGAPEERETLSLSAKSNPAVELLLRVRQSRATMEPEENGNDQEEEDDLADLADADKEARLLALRLRELHAQKFSVWDESKHGFRPMQWNDVAILLRSRASKAESYAKEFARVNIPLLVERGNFYQSLEIADLLNLLRVLDNPLQDLPLIAVLRSPLVGLTLDELATIRLTGRGPFWEALLRCKGREEGREKMESSTPLSSLLSSLSFFLDRFHRWRRLARRASLAHCLDAILAETHYAAWLLTQSQGEQRYANVQRLLGLAHQFDLHQRHGLFRFLRFIEAQQLAELEPPVASVSAENSVRLMSIHQSKGLEFPVVALPDLGKPFNVSDERADLILDEKFGLCPQIRSPESGVRYPSLAHWLAAQRQHQEMLGEELRLLYVAMTRAKDRLLLSTTVSERKFGAWWKQKQPVTARKLASARSYADWVGCWFGHQFDLAQNTDTNGEDKLLCWRIHEDKDLRVSVEIARAEEKVPLELSESWPQLRQRLEWKYPFTTATQAPAKTSVTLLRRRATGGLEEEVAEIPGLHEHTHENSPLTPPLSPLDTERKNRSAMVLPAEEKAKGNAKAPASSAAVRRFRAQNLGFGSGQAERLGNAHHKFLQWVSLQDSSGLEGLKREAERLRENGCLTAEDIALLNFEALAAFWQSELGKKILANKEFVRRELLFTARFSLEEIAAITGETPAPDPADECVEFVEFVVVQGVADLVVILPSELWLLDFKTDNIRENGDEKVRAYEPQLRLYAQALSRIYSRPVTECWIYFLARGSAIPIRTR